MTARAAPGEDHGCREREQHQRVRAVELPRHQWLQCSVPFRWRSDHDRFGAANVFREVWADADDLAGTLVAAYQPRVRASAPSENKQMTMDGRIRPVLSKARAHTRHDD
jgi:hypothetical protein